MDGAHLGSEELGVSWASGLVEELPEEGGSPVDLEVQMTGSIWQGEGEWISLHLCRTGSWYSAGLEKPISMARERTVNFVEMGQKGKERPVWLRCRGPVSGRLVRTLTFPHSWL